MSNKTCKRFWEGTLGIAISPRKKLDGEYFWSFSFVRAFRRTRESNWEYVHNFGQQHATALGTLMTKGFLFMEQNDPARFLADAMAAPTAESESEAPASEMVGYDVKRRPPLRAAA